MAALFSLDELHQICFDLDVPFDGLPGETIQDKARSLYLYTERRGDLHRLVDACQRDLSHAGPFSRLE